MNTNIRIPWSDWEVVRVIGRGGFGTVYEIQKDVFGKKESAALKVLTIPESKEEIEELYSQGYDDQSISAHFKGYLQDVLGEYSLMVELKGHANVVYCDEIKYVQHANGIGWDVFIKMELLTPLNKVTFADYDEEKVINLGKDLCNALTYCNKQGIIHRDIKPQNIFVSKDGSYKLGDFGVAKVSDKTMSGTKIGTYEYMAPEVYRAQHYGPRVDIYSLGIVMYWMMNQKCTPFLPLPPQIPTSSEKENARNRRLDGEMLPPPVNGSDRLKAIVLKACAFEPQSRYASAQDMLNALQKINAVNYEPIPEPVDLDIHKEMTFEHTNHPAGKYLSIQVDAKEVHFSVPMDIKDGQTIHLKGKGRYDRSTGTSGDLYIIMHIKKAPSQPFPVKQVGIGAVTLLAIILSCVLFFAKDNTNKDEQRTVNAHQTSTQPEETITAYCAELRNSGKFEEAVQYLKKTVVDNPQDQRYADLLSEYESLLINSILSNAQELALSEQYRLAIQTLDDAWNQYGYQELFAAAAKYRREFGISNTSFFSAGKYNTLLIRDNGRVNIVGDNSNRELDADGWSNIVAVSAGDRHVVGLKANGTVVAEGENKYEQCNVNGWYNVVAVSAGDVHTVALMEDGFVDATGFNNQKQCNVEKLMSAAGEKEIVSIAAGYHHTLALLEDGSVVACGSDSVYKGCCDVYNWSDIVSIYAGTSYSAGLKSDGTVVVAGETKAGENVCNVWNVSEWTDIVNLAAGDYFLVGLKADGTVLSAGLTATEMLSEIAAWHNIVHISAGHDHVVALTSTGRVLCAGGDGYGQCDFHGTTIVYPINNLNSHGGKR